MKAAGVNPADLKQLRGQFGRSEASLPLRLGNEISGVVTAVGPNASGPTGAFTVGDEVVAFRITGGYSEQRTVSAAAVLHKPAGLAWNQAAGLLLTGTTAFHMLHATGVTAGDRVLVHGASGAVGLLVIQLAVLRGATVVGTASASNQDLVRSFGAEPVVYGPGLADRVRAIFPSGVDVALDTVGSDEAVDVSVELVSDRARIATIAAFARGAEFGIALLGGGPGADPGSAVRMGSRAELVELAGRGDLKVLIGQEFPLEKAADALELIASGHPGGKIVLVA
jgi:NADPH:quinone reductase-like Zn-dependent oxidoreductase